MRLPVDDDVLCAAVVVAATVGIAMLSKTTRGDRSNAPQVGKAAKDLMQQSLTWLDMSASHADAVYKLQAATLATAYCNAARTLASDEDLARALNVDVQEKLRSMEALQRKMLQKAQQGGGSASKAPKAKGTALPSSDARDMAGGGLNWL